MIKTFKTGKTPCTDGLPEEWYKTFEDELSPFHGLKHLYLSYQKKVRIEHCGAHIVQAEIIVEPRL